MSDTWLQTVKKISRYHKKAQKLNPAHTQLETAQLLGVAPKIVSMSLSIYPVLSDDKIRSKLGLRGAYQEVLQRRKNKKSLLLESLFQ
jgi:hypothetical protein